MRSRGIRSFSIANFAAGPCKHSARRKRSSTIFHFVLDRSRVLFFPSFSPPFSPTIPSIRGLEMFLRADRSILPVSPLPPSADLFRIGRTRKRRTSVSVAKKLFSRFRKRRKVPTPKSARPRRLCLFHVFQYL